MQKKSPLITLTLTTLATAVLLGLAGCGSKDAKPAATQVAAKVGSEEISVHQINQVLQRTPAASQNPQAVSRAVLEKLIDQQLVVDQATEAKLHRSPEVVAQIEAARRDILARAYMQKLAGSLPKPGPEEVKKYFADNPQLFTERRIFALQEIVVPKSQANTAALAEANALLSSGRSFDDIAAALGAKGIVYTTGSATRAAEQIPLDLLGRLHAVKDGQSTVVDTAQTLTLVRVNSSQLSPVAEAAALPRIEQFLANQRASDAAAAEVKRLRASTTITYMGEFAQPASGATAAAPSGGPAAAATAVSAPEVAPAPVDSIKSAIERGVSGLK